ncbi:Ubiquitin carboxyl-terminal hydrolase 8 [Glycine soja]|uniref:Ubiquitin carboxyl-terminal hydrolase 8 n=1 Tax=Glycine soja TaxID=3848 RepID=A0A0B2RPJ7_GLYSO|nr:Ubiquitin carboxyl-terminal hydrolase 8 [Glycine soja]
MMNWVMLLTLQTAAMGNDADSNSGTEDDIHSSTDFEFYLQGLERAKIIVNKPLTQRMQESVSIYKCLEAFLKEEPLGPEDMWYCPNCKNPQQASKKLDFGDCLKLLLFI